MLNRRCFLGAGSSGVQPAMTSGLRCRSSRLPNSSAQSSRQLADQGYARYWLPDEECSTGKIEVPIYEFAQTGIVALKPATFGLVNLQERRDLQRLLRENIEVIAPETLVISEEFGEWEDSKRRIDLLGVDRDANLVVIELKRTEDGGHMELQAIRYAYPGAIALFISAT